MAYYLHGIQVSDVAAMSKLRHDTGVNVAEYPIFGSDMLEVQIVSVKNRNMQISILIRKEDVGDDQVEYVVDNLNGLVARLSPLHIRSDEVAIFGSSKDVFVVLTNMTVDWEAGTTAVNLTAIVNIDCIIIGTPDSVFGLFAVKSQMRNGDYVGIIPGRSTVGLPYSAPGFVPNVNQALLSPSRNGTIMLDLGDTTYGFCDDTITQEAEAVDIGEVRFNIDTANLNFHQNAVKVYDEGFTPRKRVLSRFHEFTGNLAIESELYRIVLDKTTSTCAMYTYTGPGTYEPSPFETFMFFGMTGYTVVMNKDEIVRVHLNSGDYIEIERGKDPVVKITDLGAPAGFGYTLATPINTGSNASTNYALLGPSVYICSNYEFDITSAQVIKTRTPLDPPLDQVFSIVYSTGAISGNGRNREILKEIS